MAEMDTGHPPRPQSPQGALRLLPLAPEAAVGITPGGHAGLCQAPACIWGPVGLEEPQRGRPLALVLQQAGPASVQPVGSKGHRERVSRDTQALFKPSYLIIFMASHMAKPSIRVGGHCSPGVMGGMEMREEGMGAMFATYHHDLA